MRIKEFAIIKCIYKRIREYKDEDSFKIVDVKTITFLGIPVYIKKDYLPG